MAMLIFLAAIAYVLRGMLGKSELARKEIQKNFPWLFDHGFRFLSSAGPFASVLAIKLDTGADLKLHFRFPGRGYTGGVGYNGVHFFLLQLSNFSVSSKATLLCILEMHPGAVTFENETQIQWQPAESKEETANSGTLKNLVETLGVSPYA